MAYIMLKENNAYNILNYNIIKFTSFLNIILCH